MTIRIAHVNVSRGFRGGERQTQLLVDELAKDDIQQVLVVRRGDTLARRMQCGHVEVRPVSGNPIGVFQATRGVDVVHAHDGRSVYGAYLRSLVSGTAYIVTRRVNNPIGDHWFAHAAYRRAGFVVSVAQEIAQVVERFDSQIRSQVIHSASSGFIVDSSKSAAIRNAFTDKFVIGHVGALDNRQKGQEYIIEVARELQSSNPEFEFVLVGDGDDEQTLKTAAADCSNITFTGFVDNVGDYLAAFDLLILPSNREGIGGILLDAMEQALPVIATRVGGIPEIVRDGSNGILIESGRPEQLKSAILSLASSPQLRRRLGECGREFAKDFTPAIMAKKYLGLYKSLLPGAG